MDFIIGIIIGAYFGFDALWFVVGLYILAWVIRAMYFLADILDELLVKYGSYFCWAFFMLMIYCLINAHLLKRKEHAAKEIKLKSKIVYKK
ncbi:MAG: hypothetical protein K2X69_05440 [Silvanigrellaceae bacterium]|nr:hypothetical protein [Silvanigrellaceae bacterium]